MREGRGQRLILERLRGTCRGRQLGVDGGKMITSNQAGRSIDKAIVEPRKKKGDTENSAAKALSR
jgi:hypothetical protein